VSTVQTNSPSCVFTARCTIVQSAVLSRGAGDYGEGGWPLGYEERRCWANCPCRISFVRPSVCLSVCLSVRLSVTLVDQDHIGWKSWKLTARTISPSPSLFDRIAQSPSAYSQGNMGKVLEE